MENLAKNEKQIVRFALTDKGVNTPLEILAELSKDENVFIRKSVAENPNTPKEILEQLSHDEDEWVREAVVKNSK